jgi:predicted phosphoribosyltransferase
MREDAFAMRFKNRDEAARRLAERLASYRGQHPLVLGVPRGAVPMAAIIADALEGDLDVVLVRKLRAPGQPELAIGAVDDTGAVVKGEYFDIAAADYVRQEVQTQLALLRQRREAYGGAHASIPPAGRVVVLVDDGVATGASMEAAIHAVRAKQPKTLVVAIGVAPTATVARLRALADAVVCLHDTEAFYAVGQFFEDFGEVTDDDVVAALKRAGGTTRGPVGGPPVTPDGR